MWVAAFIILWLVLLTALLLNKILHAVTVKELKRRARVGHDTTAARLYKFAAYGGSASLFLWLVAGLCLGGLVILVERWPFWSVLVLGLIISWFFWGFGLLGSYDNLFWRAASYIAVPAAKLVGWLHPILGKLSAKIRRFNPGRQHTNAYEKEDLLEILKLQHHQPDNRVSDSDLKLAITVLASSDKTVGQAMRLRKTVKWVDEDEPVGPLLMDELHDSGLECFPVVKSSSKKSAHPEIVGTLYMHDLVDHTSGGRVSGLMRKAVYFINEDDSLREALAAISSTHHHLLIVVNHFQEVVGVLPFNTLMEQLLGQKPHANFDRYHDKQAVADKTKEEDGRSK